jgi:predicted transcriptional regulator
MAYKLKRKEVEAKLRELSGNVAVTAQAFGVSRTAIYNFIHKHGLYEVVQEARESMTDIAETSLKRAVINGEAWAVCFTLKTLGKSRGYVERVQQEISGRDGEAIEIKNTVFDHGAAVASLAARSADHYREPGEVQNRGDGAPVG